MPGRSSKHIRKVDRSPLSDFDDQLWPINVAIVILGGIAAGTIVATSSFDDPRTLHNAWVRLGGVGAVMAVLFCAVVWLQGKMLRRVQLCLIVSLMVHIGLVLYLRDQYLDILATLDREGGQNPSGQRDPITMPDYHWEQIERPDVPQSFEEPVEVETPDHPDEATPEPQPVDPRVQPQDLRVEHKLVEQRQPDPAELRRAEPVMAPRRAEALSGSQLSRQQVDHRLEKTEPQSQPEVKAGEAPQASRLKSHTAEADRRSTAPEQVDLARHAPAEVPRVNAQQSAMRAAKAETAPEAEPAVSQALARRQTAAAGMPTPLESLPDQIAAVADPQHPRTPGESGAVGRAAAAAPSVRSVAASEAVKEAMAVAPALGQSGLRRSAAQGEPSTPKTSDSAPIARSDSRTLGPLAVLPLEQPTATDVAASGASSGSAGDHETPISSEPLAPSGRSSTAIPAQALAGAGDPAVNIPSGGVVAAGYLDAPSRPGASSGPGAREVGGGPIGRAPAVGSLPGPTVLLDDLPPASVAAAGASEVATPAPGSPAADGDVARRTSGGLPVEIAAVSGPGGLRYDPAQMLGIPSRRARPESELVHRTASRFVAPRSGGDLAMEGRLREMSKEAFRERDPGTRGQTARARGGSESTERAVEMGLDFLARHQFPDGHWSLDRLPAAGRVDSGWGAGQMNADTAGTGLSLLAFLGAGYTHREEKYRTVVRSGLDWLVANQQADGRLFSDATDQTLFGRMYGHGIATIAMCEAYGMTKDPDLREPAQRAIGFILDAQHPTQGGWRYEPRLESDTSVSGWQLMALRSAQMAGLTIPDENLRRVGRWLDQAQATGGSRYRYNPYAADTPEQRHGRVPNRTMTAEGLLMRMYLGWARDNASLIEGAEFLKSNLPEVGTRDQSLRDSYYWYYATQVMFHMQGEYWTAWNERLHPLLETSQVAKGPLAGSWDPNAPVVDRWAQAAGRLYVTTLNLLMLEVYYRHLPLYQTERL